LRQTGAKDRKNPVHNPARPERPANFCAMDNGRCQAEQQPECRDECCRHVVFHLLKLQAHTRYPSACKAALATFYTQWYKSEEREVNNKIPSGNIVMDDTEKPARGRPRTMSMDSVLDVAVCAYQRTDPADVSVNAICKMASVSKPSLYRVFGNEDGLTLAALDRYAERVLADMFKILKSGQSLGPTLEALIDFAVNDPRLETGCLFYKMRAGKHRLGPQTRDRVDQIDAAAVQGFETFLQARQDAGEWNSPHPIPMLARYLREQIGLALTQRATMSDSAQIRAALTMALSVIKGA
jgi:AcrR family transcriptional regulator